MPVVPSDLQLFQSAVMGTSATAPTPIGGAIGSTQILGSTIGEIFYIQAEDVAGGSVEDQFQKVFIKNANSSSDLLSTVVFLASALKDVASNGTLTLVSDSASDDSTKFVRVIGLDASGLPQQDDYTLNGTTPATGSGFTWSFISRLELRLVSGGALTTAVGNISATRGILLGIIPTGRKTATAEVSFGFAAALNDSGTSTNAGTDPGGITYDKPSQSTGASGTPVANSGTLTHGSKQGTWMRLQVKPGILPSADTEIILRPYGTSAA